MSRKTNKIVLAAVAAIALAGAAVKVNAQASRGKSGVWYEGHLGYAGWRAPAVLDGKLVGALNGNLPGYPLTGIQALNVFPVQGGSGGKLPGNIYICGQAHVGGIGWMAPHCFSQQSTADFIGTVGQSRYIQAVKFWLGGTGAEDYEICYRSQVAGPEWMSVVCSGAGVATAQQSGTTGQSRSMYAIEINVGPKNSANYLWF